MSLYPDSTLVANAAFVKAYAAQKKISSADAIDRQPSHLQHSGVKRLMEKSAIGPITGPDLIPETQAVAFLKTQKLCSFFAAGLDNGFQRLPFDIRAAASTSVAFGTVVEPGEFIPLSAFNIGGKKLSRRLATALTVANKELLERGDSVAVNALHSLLADACTTAVDAHVFGDVQGHSGTDTNASSGSTPAAFLSDFRNMLDHVNIAGAGQLYWIASRDAANRLNGDSVIFQNVGPQGGEILNLPLIISDGLVDDSSGGTLMLIDASKVAANVESITIDTSQSASLQMSSTPTDGATDTVSMFQTGSVAIRSGMTFGFELLDGFRASVLEGIS